MASSRGNGQLNFFPGKDYDIFPGKVIVVGTSLRPTTSNAVVLPVTSISPMHVVQEVISYLIEGKELSADEGRPRLLGNFSKKRCNPRGV